MEQQVMQLEYYSFQLEYFLFHLEMEQQLKQLGLHLSQMQLVTQLEC